MSFRSQRRSRTSASYPWGRARTREGIHLGAVAGTIDLVQRCYTGLEVHHSSTHNLDRAPTPITVAGEAVELHPHETIAIDLQRAS